ncbi:MAG: hypothetical protein Q9183_003012 [Haloplaca sp. 2 TL-2023]
MQFSTVFVAAALPFLISASPAERRSGNKKLTTGIVEKRRGEEPGCSFNGRIGNAYIPDPTGDGKSCFGFDNGGAITCGGPYKQEEIDDIKEAVKQQVAKEGWRESSSVGEWTANFQTLTTAFSSRDTTGFDKSLDSVNVEGESGAGQLTYYWQREGDYLQVSRSTCPGGEDLFGGIFGKKD